MVSQVVVIDIGSYTCRAGLAGDDAPRAVFPSVIGRPRHSCHGDSASNMAKFLVGEEAVSQRDVLGLKYPVEQGLITNWDDMEKACDMSHDVQYMHTYIYSSMFYTIFVLNITCRPF